MHRRWKWLTVGGVAAVLVAVVAWPGGWPRAAASSLTQHFGCFIPDRADVRPDTIGFGDSITAGHTFPDLRIGANDSYFDVLACQANSPIDALRNAGHSGYTTTQLVGLLDADVLDYDPEQVLVLAGTNDVYFDDTTATITNLEHIRFALEKGGIASRFGLLPPSSTDPAETVTMNEQIRAWATEHGVALIDYYTPLVAEDGSYRAGLSDDGIHPNRAGAKIMAETAAAALR